MFGVLTTLAFSVFASLAPVVADDGSTTQQEFERLQGFSTVVLNHVAATLGTDHLPDAAGLPVEPGIFATVMLDRVQIYDQDVAGLTAGRIAESTAAAECESGCPSVFFDAFQAVWLDAAIESTVHGVEIPQRVLFAVDEQVPVQSLVALAYAAAESRPIAPPSLHLLVSSARGGLRAQRFYLLPPQGLNLPQGSAALGLTIAMGPGHYVVTATDPLFAREHVAGNAAQLRLLLADIKRRYPGKETVIIVPDPTITLGEMMGSLAAVQAAFPRTVLSAGQSVRTP